LIKKYKPIKLKRSKNEFILSSETKKFYVKCVRYKESSVGIGVINKMVTNTYNFKNIILILCTENSVSDNAFNLIDELNKSIFVTSQYNIIRKIESFK
jgi:hypothetical protein